MVLHFLTIFMLHIRIVEVKEIKLSYGITLYYFSKITKHYPSGIKYVYGFMLYDRDYSTLHHHINWIKHVNGILLTLCNGIQLR